MAKLTDAVIPNLIFAETASADVATPAADQKQLFVDTDGSFKLKDEAGAVTAIGGSLTAASQAEMEAGVEAALRSMSPLRVAQAIAALAGGGGGDPWTEIVKSADQTVTNQTVAQDDTEQFCAVAANSAYHVEQFLLYSGNSGSGDMRYTWSYPSVLGFQFTGRRVNHGASGGVENSGMQGQASNLAHTTPGDLILFCDALHTIYPAFFEFILITGGTAGTLRFKFANVSGGAGVESTVRQGSRFRWRKIR